MTQPQVKKWHPYIYRDVGVVLVKRINRHGKEIVTGRTSLVQATLLEQSKYGCEKLRQLRAERGVGRRIAA